MQRFLITLLVCSAIMSLLALLYMAAMPSLEKRYSERGRYYAWLIIVLGLVIPFRPQSDNALVKLNAPFGTAAPVMQIGNAAPVTLPVGHIASAASMPSVSWWQIAAALWLAGMLVSIAYHAIKHDQFMKMVKRWSESITDQQTLRLLRDLESEMGICKPINIVRCSSIGTPMVVGLFHPQLLLPAQEFSDDELRFILKHELVHYKRKDLYYKSFVLLATCLHWFNPIVHLMAKSISVLCESSCDAAVVRSTDADARLRYSETIIGVARFQSKRKTALSTNFYGGKNGMKKRIFSIMDTGSKKTGVAIICAALAVTLGSGAAFAADYLPAQPGNPTENIAIETAIVFAPNPAVYDVYSPYGISISEDGQKLLYNGQEVRQFHDQGSDAPTYYFDENGTVNLSVERNAAGEITGLAEIAEEEAQNGFYAFFSDEEATTWTSPDSDAPNKYLQYEPFGITISDDDILYYNGQRVRMFVDQRGDKSFEVFWQDEGGSVDLEVERDSSGNITGINPISEEKINEFNAALREGTSVRELASQVGESVQKEIDGLFIDTKSSDYDEFRNARDESGAKSGVWKKGNPAA